nr:DNA internalization-related competence protein ComEC/Rec2 [Aestuariicella hydrocarbonica]
MPSLNLCVLAAVLILVATTCVWGGLASDSRKIVLIKVCTVALVFVWAISWGRWQLDGRLKPSLEGQDVWVEGRIDGLVSRQEQGGNHQSPGRVVQRFTFKVDGFYGPEHQRLNHRLSRLRLSVYGGPPVSGGEGWRFLVRLKRPHGFANPGGFDYERWLLSRSIAATGYVRLGKVAGGIGAVSSAELATGARAFPGAQRLVQKDSRFQRWRSGLRQRLTASLGEGRSLAVLLALTMGDRSLLADQDTRVIQQMGLSHLLAISGLHIGLAAALGFWIGRGIGAGLSVCWPLRFYGPHCAWLGALLTAFLYASLAGFSLATQRAVVVLMVAAVWYCSYRRYSVWLGWWLSMMVVLMLHPLSILEPGFWFSFVAVALLMLVLSRPVNGFSAKVWMLLKVQFCLFLFMGALQLYWGMAVSTVAPLVNMIAVPYVSVLIVPLILLSLFFSVFSDGVSGALWKTVHGLIDGFWWGLDLTQRVATELLFEPGYPLHPGLLMMGGLGLLLAILPAFPVTRLLGLMVVVALVMPATKGDPHTGVTVLDVGQGLSVLASSQNKHLLYDTGPGDSSGFNAGDAVVLPLLYSRGIQRIDRGVISHWDSDHSGGFESVRAQVGAKQWLSGEELPEEAGEWARSFSFCNKDQRARVGDWRVFVIAAGSDRWPEGNNASCVILLESQGVRVLLPGDVEAQRERLLLSHPRLQQPVDVLLAAHHGSNTSSIQPWIDQLSPQWVVFSAGYRNRYGHPHPKVVDRYRQAGARILTTADLGAIEFRLSSDRPLKPSLSVRPYRLQKRRYWRSYNHPFAGLNNQLADRLKFEVN